MPSDRHLNPKHTAEISPSVDGLQATHAVHGLANPYIPHTPTDSLSLDYSCPTIHVAVT